MAKDVGGICQESLESVLMQSYKSQLFFVLFHLRWPILLIQTADGAVTKERASQIERFLDMGVRALLTKGTLIKARLHELTFFGKVIYGIPESIDVQGGSYVLQLKRRLNSFCFDLLKTGVRMFLESQVLSIQNNLCMQEIVRVFILALRYWIGIY